MVITSTFISALQKKLVIIIPTFILKCRLLWVKMWTALSKCRFLCDDKKKMLTVNILTVDILMASLFLPLYSSHNLPSPFSSHNFNSTNCLPTLFFHHFTSAISFFLLPFPFQHLPSTICFHHLPSTIFLSLFYFHNLPFTPVAFQHFPSVIFLPSFAFNRLPPSLHYAEVPYIFILNS